MTTEIEEAIKQRDEAKQNNDEPRYKEADEKVKDLITEKKKEIWKRKVLDSQEAGNVWQMVRNLKDGPRECKNKAIIHNNKTRITNRQKARAFMNHYERTTLHYRNHYISICNIVSEPAPVFVSHQKSDATSEAYKSEGRMYALYIVSLVEKGRLGGKFRRSRERRE